MNYKKMLIAMTSTALLLGLGYGPTGEASSGNSVAQSSEAAAKAKADQDRKKFKNLLDQEQKALSAQLKPGEMRYVYINDKEYHASFPSNQLSGRFYTTVYMTYKEYVEKYTKGNTAMALQLPQPPAGYDFSQAVIAPYVTQKEREKIQNQVIAEGKASGKKIYVKTVQEKRNFIQLIYTMASEKNGIKGVLAITAEPAGPKDKAVESEPVKAQSEKLKVGSQEVVYTAIDKQEYKSVAWMNPKTRVNYVIRDNRGILDKKALITLTEQIIAASR